MLYCGSNPGEVLDISKVSDVFGEGLELRTNAILSGYSRERLTLSGARLYDSALRL